MKPRRLSIVAISAALGAMLPLADGCGEPCPREMAVESGYRILGGSTGWVKDSGRIEVSDSTMTVLYSTDDGSSWAVEYRRTE